MRLRDLVRALALVAALTPALPAAGDPPPVASALGDEGQLYQVIPGAFGALFPEDGSQPADSPALALDVVAPDGSRERFLVPGSEGPEVEGSPSVVFEDSSSRLHAVWESKRSPTVSRLLLASFGDDSWSEAIEISGDVAPLKGEPKILITRDRFSARGENGGIVARSRTVIHVAWREDAAEGSGVFYTPVVLEAGRYVGWNPVVALASFEPEAPEPAAGASAFELLRVPELTAGEDVHTAVIGYVNSASGRLVTLETRILPGELGALADDIRADIIEIGAREPGKVQAVAEKCRADIIEIGNRLNGGIVRHFADRASGSVAGISSAEPERPLEALADDVRADIIEIGADLLGGPGMQRKRSRLLEIGPAGPPASGGSNPPATGTTHLVRIQLVSDRPAPPLDGVAAKIFMSEDGERVLVGWASKGKVFYTETLAQPGPKGEAWTAVKHMTLTERLGIPEAAAILEARVRRQR